MQDQVCVCVCARMCAPDTPTKLRKLHTDPLCKIQSTDASLLTIELGFQTSVRQEVTQRSNANSIRVGH